MDDSMRCLVCGSAKQEGGEWAGTFKCAKCGAAMGLRGERCWVSNHTIVRLLPHKKTLEELGFRFESGDRLEKRSVDEIQAAAAAIYILETVRPGTVRDIVQYLKKLRIPYDEIIRLRLDEPEVVEDLYGMDDPGR